MNLASMLASLTPVLVPGEFVFCSFAGAAYGEHHYLEPIASFAESEGLTLVVPRSNADAANLTYESVFCCLTLSVHSSLDAVGLTAAFASKLTEHGISANVLAGYYHDHIFVQRGQVSRAVAALGELRDTAAASTAPTPTGQVHVGVDGCPGGWFFVRECDGECKFGVVPDVAALTADLPPTARVFIDIPIGLRDDSGEARGCDTAARALLGFPRASSVFPAPIRAVLSAANYAEANATSKALAGKGLSAQAFGLVPKIREVDIWMAQRPGASPRPREVHPELSFCALNGGVPMVHAKKTPEGFAERMALLGQRLPQAPAVVDEALERYRRKEVARDDIVDALVVLVTAMLPDRELSTAPVSPARDSTGLAMEIVYPTISQPL
ncbi:MAG: ACT domain-containing protein [Gammaproteobacteria bacterium]